MLPQLLGVRQLWLCAQPSSDDCVVAKGMDSLALTIRQIARRNNVPIVENRPLARVLWRKVKVGRGVPMDLFQAVAEVLAHVYRLRQRVLNRGDNR